MQKNNRMRVFAGPNGSGKTTLFKAFSKKYNAGYFVNADQLEKELKETGLIDLKTIPLKASNDDLLLFRKSDLAQSILKKAETENCSVDIEIREGFGQISSN